MYSKYYAIKNCLENTEKKLYYTTPNNSFYYVNILDNQHEYFTTTSA